MVDTLAVGMLVARHPYRNSILLLVEGRVQTLIVETAVKRLKLLAKVSRVRRHRMSFKGLLVLPDFHDREVIRSTALLQHLKTHMALILAARQDIFIVRARERSALC
jgi:hypothetical protein